MRLKEFQVKQLCLKMLSTLRSSQWMVPLKSDSEILGKMEAIFLKELRVEDEIDREANALLERYAQQSGQNIDRDQMFRMIKKQLVKEKKVII